MKSVLEITVYRNKVWKFLLDFIVLKSYIEIGYEPAQNMFKVNNKDTRTVSILVSVLLTSKMQLFDGQSSSFWEDI